jgi:hypothetical protein
MTMVDSSGVPRSSDFLSWEELWGETELPDLDAFWSNLLPVDDYQEDSALVKGWTVVPVDEESGVESSTEAVEALSSVPEAEVVQVSQLTERNSLDGENDANYTVPDMIEELSNGDPDICAISETLMAHAINIPESAQESSMNLVCSCRTDEVSPESYLGGQDLADVDKLLEELPELQDLELEMIPITNIESVQWVAQNTASSSQLAVEPVTSDEVRHFLM